MTCVVLIPRVTPADVDLDRIYAVGNNSDRTDLSRDIKIVPGFRRKNDAAPTDYYMRPVPARQRLRLTPPTESACYTVNIIPMKFLRFINLSMIKLNKYNCL